MKLVWIMLIVALFQSCGSSQSEEKNESKDESTISEKEDTTPKIDLKACDAKLSWEREKKLKHAETSFKIGKTEIDLNVNNLSLTTDGEFDVVSANYYEQNGMYHAIVKVDLRSLKALQKDSTDHLSLIGPNYLDVEQYPTASINLTDFNAEKGDEALAILHIKDQDVMAQVDYDYEEDDNGFKSVKGIIVLDAVSAGLINPDVVQEIEKDEITINLELKR